MSGSPFTVGITEHEHVCACVLVCHAYVSVHVQCYAHAYASAFVLVSHVYTHVCTCMYACMGVCDGAIAGSNSPSRPVRRRRYQKDHCRHFLCEELDQNSWRPLSRGRKQAPAIHYFPNGKNKARGVVSFAQGHTASRALA